MDACGTEPVTQGLNPASQLTTLVNTRVPAGREELLCSAERLEELANDCEALYQEAGTSSDQVHALTVSKQCAVQSLASVAFMIGGLATNAIEMFTLQDLLLDKLEEGLGQIEMSLDIHEEKAVRRQIGRLTLAKHSRPRPRIRRTSTATDDDSTRQYKREAVDLSSLDSLGHGASSASAACRVAVSQHSMRRRGTMRVSAHPSGKVHIKGMMTGGPNKGMFMTGEMGPTRAIVPSCRSSSSMLSSSGSNISNSIPTPPQTPENFCTPDDDSSKSLTLPKCFTRARANTLIFGMKNSRSSAHLATWTALEPALSPPNFCPVPPSPDSLVSTNSSTVDLQTDGDTSQPSLHEYNTRTQIQDPLSQTTQQQLDAIPKADLPPPPLTVVPHYVEQLACRTTELQLDEIPEADLPPPPPSPPQMSTPNRATVLGSPLLPPPPPDMELGAS